MLKEIVKTNLPCSRWLLFKNIFPIKTEKLLLRDHTVHPQAQVYHMYNIENVFLDLYMNYHGPYVVVLSFDPVLQRGSVSKGPFHSETLWYCHTEDPSFLYLHWVMCPFLNISCAPSPHLIQSACLPINISAVTLSPSSPLSSPNHLILKCVCESVFFL